jgi:hypothetical protein
MILKSVTLAVDLAFDVDDFNDAIGFCEAFSMAIQRRLERAGEGERLKSRAKPYVEPKTDLTGFGVAVYAARIKSWVREYRRHGGGHGAARKVYNDQQDRLKITLERVVIAFGAATRDGAHDRNLRSDALRNAAAIFPIVSARASRQRIANIHRSDT